MAEVDDSYSEEETDRRMDATVKAMIAMKPRPHEPKRPQTPEKRVKPSRVRKPT